MNILRGREEEGGGYINISYLWFR